MKNPPLEEVIIIKRYKRFLVDVETPLGEIVTVHCPNSGSMKTCIEPGWKGYISTSNNPKRKLKYTLEFTHNGDTFICTNTQKANALLEEAIQNNQTPFSKENLKREDKINAHTRLDFSFGTPKQYIEVKSVTMKHPTGKNTFPDAVTTRGTKHLNELIALQEQGHQTHLVFVILRQDTQGFTPESTIDPIYAQTLKKAQESNVKIWLCQTKITKKEIQITTITPWKE